MSGSKLLLDTNIALYLLGGDEVLATVLDGKELYLSVISEMELLGYPSITVSESTKIKDFLREIEVIELTLSVKERTIELRQLYNLKLPDAIIAATAMQQNLPLISSDGIFTRITELHFVHYEV